MWTQEQAMDAAREAMATARRIRNGGEEAVQIAQLLLHDDELGLGIALLPLFGLPDKDQMVAFVQSASRELGAFYTIFVSEAYMKMAPSIPDGPLSEDPEAKEVIFVSVDGVGGFQALLTSEINADGTFGDVIESVVTGHRTEGRMTNMSTRLTDN